MDNSNIDRREFLTKSATLAIGTSLAVGVFTNCAPTAVPPKSTTSTTTTALDITQPVNSALANINGGIKITINGQTHPVVVTRISQTDVAAFSSRCTHQGCEVGLPSSTGKITCPCHSSTFSIDGHVTGGPATSNLLAYTAKLDGNIITISN